MLKVMVSVGGQSLVKLLLTLISLKVVALVAGPAGFAVLGQLQALLQISGAAVSSVASSGVVKLISERRYSSELIVYHAVILLVVFSALLTVVFAVSVPTLSRLIFDGGWRIALFLIPISAFFIGFNNFLVSYYNGKHDYRRLFNVSIKFTLYVAVVTVFTAWVYGKDGAIYTVVVSPILAGLCILIPWLRSNFTPLVVIKADAVIIKELLSFSIMAIGSAVFVYGGQIFLRDYIAESLSIDLAGIWFSVTKLSEVYMGIASVVCSAIFLPRYASRFGEELSKEAGKMLFLACGFAIFLVGGVLLTSSFWISIIYGADFERASSIIDMYVIGDGLKLISWAYLYVFICKKKVVFFLFFEIASSVLYVTLSIYALKFYGFDYISGGYVCQASITCLAVVFIFYLNKNKLCSVSNSHG